MERHKKMPKKKWKGHKMLQISTNTNYCAQLYFGTTLCHILDFTYYHRSYFGFTSGVLRKLNIFSPIILWPDENKDVLQVNMQLQYLEIKKFISPDTQIFVHKRSFSRNLFHIFELLPGNSFRAGRYNQGSTRHLEPGRTTINQRSPLSYGTENAKIIQKKSHLVIIHKHKRPSKAAFFCFLREWRKWFHTLCNKVLLEGLYCVANFQCSADYFCSQLKRQNCDQINSIIFWN